MHIYLSLILSYVVTTVITPMVRWLALRTDAIDIPTDSRRMHTVPIPRLGGVAIAVGVLVPLIILYEVTASIVGIVVAVAVLEMGAYLDDTKGLSAKSKFAFQFLAANVIYMFGIRIEHVILPPFGHIEFAPWLSYTLTVIWIPTVANAINFMDGLDGLATGLGVIAGVALLIVSILFSDALAIVLSASLIGSLAGFWPYNFKPASIFMGETGSSFIGFILALLAIRIMSSTDNVLSLVVPMLILILPLVDMVHAIIRRWMRGVSPAVADKGHVHHKLVAAGFSHVESVVILYVIAAYVSLLAVVLLVLNL